MTERPEPVTRADGSSAQLLVVDDEEALLDLLGDALRFAGSSEGRSAPQSSGRC